MMARFGASSNGLDACPGSLWTPASADSSASGMSHLPLLVIAGAGPDVQNCVTLRAPVKQNSSHCGPELAETLVGSVMFCDPVGRRAGGKEPHAQAAELRRGRLSRRRGRAERAAD